MKFPLSIFITLSINLICSSFVSAQTPNEKIDIHNFTSIDFNPNALTEIGTNQNQENYTKQRTAYENQLQTFIANKKTNPHIQSIITIPIVVHVVYSSPIQNISDDQIFSQLLVLNEDYGRTNADTTNTPAPFAAVAANTGIQFCLAQVDPNGGFTNGIERRQTSSSPFNSDAVKHYSQGGLDIWDPTRYLNIWVCDALGAWGEFPTGTVSNTFGAVIQYDHFGSNHTSYGTFSDITSTYDRGRTAVHEIGHCLNLYHIWGDDGNACSGTDYCADTPNQAGATNGNCYYPFLDACTNSGDGVMCENYMDYSSDWSKNIFTQDQSARMNAVLSIPPYNALASSNVCQPLSSVNESSLFTTVTVYPNPSNGQLTINLNQNYSGKIEIRITDVMGNLVSEMKLKNAGENNIEIDLREKADGIYFIELITDQEVFAKKIMLSKK